MAATLALIAAFLFALAATLQQKGALALGDVSLGSPSSLAKLAKQRIWLLGSIALLIGYVVQAAALDRGRLAIIQPLLVMTVVFALPLGYWLTNQTVGRQEIAGAVVIVFGLAAFAIFGDPASGEDDAPFSQWAVPLALFLGIAVVALVLGGRGATPLRKAALYGISAGVLFGLSAALAKPTVETLHDGLEDVLTSWEAYLMAATGIAAFVVQQVSLSAGRLAASVSTVSVSNPIVAIAIGAIVLDETLARPAWHIVVAVAGLVAALGGAIAISLASDRAR